MSFDISLKIKTGQNSYNYPYEDNYTYNVAEMFYMALGNEGLRVLDGVMASEAVEKLETAISDMYNRPNEYKAHNPPNGWGDYEGALDVLINLKNACQEHEFCTINIS